MFVPMVFFFVWNPGLFNGDAKTPKRTYGLLTGATLLSPLWFVGGWRDRIIVQGLRYYYSECAINTVWIIILCSMFIRNWKAEPSFKANLLLHWLLVVWLAWPRGVIPLKIQLTWLAPSEKSRSGLWSTRQRRFRRSLHPRSTLDMPARVL